MKKSIYYFAAVAAMLLSFSCAKEIEKASDDELVNGFEYVFNISDENSDLTKTTLDGTAVKWETDDKIGVFATGTTNKYGQIKTLNPVQFPVYLAAALSAGDKVYCYYPYNASNDSKTAATVSLTIPASQTGDFDAMPQVAIPYTAPADMAKGSTPVGDINFCNLGSVIRFLVYSSTGAYDDETVKSIKFTADKALAGNFTFDLTAVDYADPSTLSISGYGSLSAQTAQSPAVGTSTSNAGAADLVIAPGTYYGTILLVTDKAKYTYTLTEPNKITFARNKIKKIGLDLESANCTRIETHPVGEVFVPATSITAGDKVVFASGTSGAVAVLGVQQENNRKAVDYTITDGAIISNASIYPLTVGAGTTEPSYFTLYDPVVDGYLYAASSGSNHLKSEDAVSVNSEWQIVLDGESKATTLKATGSSNRNIMRYNNGSAIFSCYSSGQKDIYVFKKSTATLVSAANQDLAYTVTSVTIDYNVYNGSGSTTVAFKTNPGSCASNLAINESTKKVTFDITVNTGATRTVEVNITNNGVTKTVSINQAAAPVKLDMSAITATSAQNQIVFSWTAVEHATGYQVSTDGGSSYGSTQAATSYTWSGLDPFTEHTIKVKAIGDGGVYYIDSDPGSLTAKTKLAVPTSLTWNKATLTVSWTDPNTGAGSYGTVYEYQYTIDDGANFTAVTGSNTSVTLTITESKTFKIKAVCIADASYNSTLSSGLTCNVGDALAGIPVSWPIVEGTAPTISSKTFSATPTSVGTATLQLFNDSGVAQTLTTTTASSGTGVYNSSFEKDWYWLFAIPVENLKATDSIKLQAGLYNNDSQTYSIFYSTDNSTWTDTGETISQASKKSTAIKSATFTTTNIANGTLYLKLVGGTTCSSRLVKEIGFTIDTP